MVVTCIHTAFLLLTILNICGLIMHIYIGRVGSQIVVPHRGDEYYCNHLKVMGDLGQINFQVGSLL